MEFPAFYHCQQALEEVTKKMNAHIEEGEGGGGPGGRGKGRREGGGGEGGREGGRDGNSIINCTHIHTCM